MLYVLHMTHFGAYVRERREILQQSNRRYSLRQVAQRIGLEPAYLSKIERGEASPPSEATTVKLAVELGEDPDMLLAMAGKVSSDLQEIIRKRPKLFADDAEDCRIGRRLELAKQFREQLRPLADDFLQIA